MKTRRLLKSLFVVLSSILFTGCSSGSGGLSVSPASSVTSGSSVLAPPAPAAPSGACASPIQGQLSLITAAAQITVGASVQWQLTASGGCGGPFVFVGPGSPSNATLSGSVASQTFSSEATFSTQFSAAGSAVIMSVQVFDSTQSVSSAVTVISSPFNVLAAIPPVPASPAPGPACLLSASPQTITLGQSLSLSFSTDNTAISATLRIGAGTASPATVPSDVQSLTPSVAGQFVAIGQATNAQGVAGNACQVVYTVAQPAAPTCTLVVNGTPSSSSVAFNLTVSGASQAKVDGVIVALPSSSSTVPVNEVPAALGPITSVAQVLNSVGAAVTCSVQYNVPAPSTIPLYRLFSPGNGDNMISSDPNEATGAPGQTNFGYVAEGVDFYLYSVSTPACNVYVTRCFDVTTQRHFVSSTGNCSLGSDNTQNGSGAVIVGGVNYGGVAGYGCAAPMPNTVALYGGNISLISNPGQVVYVPVQ